jgi:hypothetical protein
MISRSPLLLTFVLLHLGLGVARGPALGADPIFSGPQPGEKISPFKVIELTGPNAGQERNPVAEHGPQPTALVFIHGIERSLVPLLRVVDEYGALHPDQLKVELVFLAADRLAGEARVKAAADSLKLQSRVGLSLDGAEGPGNYGLNAQCLMTLVTATNRQVLTNFALVQPGIADAPAVLAALARAGGDTNPPTVAQLTERHQARNGGPRDGSGRMAREAGTPDAKPKEKFPGAVPTDARLQGLLRSFIRPTNDVATVDRVLGEVRAHIQGNAELRQQAIDGWVRVLHFGDRYGTEYSRKVGREFLAQLQLPPEPAPVPKP